MSKILLVANRLPVKIELRRGSPLLRMSPGGLATGLGALHRQGRTLWIGWPGVADEDLAIDGALGERLARRRFVPVPLSRRDVDLYYNGFANATLWPLFHSFISYAAFEPTAWEAYRAVNERFAEAVLRHYEAGDRIWVHDYHLMLLPALLRRALPEAEIGFFLHIPFPPYDVLHLLPWHGPLVEGLLGADLVGFHTLSYDLHFLDAVGRISGLPQELGRITLAGREVRTGVFPMGIDYAYFHDNPDDRRLRQSVRTIRQGFAGKKIILSVDRLDYTKGIPLRLRAFERFLASEPAWHGKVNLVLVAVPSRTDVRSYEVLTAMVERLVGEINGRYGTLGWTPVRYMHRSLPQSELQSLYRAADVMLVTPLRDGMNLVAKEFVASRADLRGVLVLSELAGAAEELPEALLVNPDDLDGLVAALKQALTMPAAEQAARLRPMQERLRRHDVAAWAREFLAALAATPRPAKVSRPLGDVLPELLHRFRVAPRRLLLLDYDGTLVPFQRRPEEAQPDPELVRLLGALALVPGTTVAVVSGRSRRPFGEWLRNLPVALVAEHGAWQRPRDGRWRAYARLDTAWKEELRPLLIRYSENTPGSFLEEKTFSLAWHYRQVEAGVARHRVRELERALRQFALPGTLGILHGDHVLEVRDVRVHKGLVATTWFPLDGYDFVLAVGDDTTDEDLFAVLPASAYAVRVGDGPTLAPFTLPDPEAVRGFLRTLVAATAEESGRHVSPPPA